MKIEIGEFYKLKDGTRLLTICRRGASSWWVAVNRGGDDVKVDWFYAETMTHLPGCTDWDWVEPEPEPETKDQELRDTRKAIKAALGRDNFMPWSMVSEEAVDTYINLVKALPSEPRCDDDHN